METGKFSKELVEAGIQSAREGLGLPPKESGGIPADPTGRLPTARPNLSNSPTA